MKSVTRELVYDFVCYRLRKAGHDDEDFGGDGGGRLIISPSTTPTTAQRTLRLMGDEFTNAYFSVFDDMTNPINVHDGNLKDVLYKILDVTCQTGIEWGRIVGIFVFTALLAVKAMDCNRTDVVENLIEWTADYLEEDRFSNWINQHGSWEGFVQFYKSPKARNQDLNQQFWVQLYTVGLNVFTKVASIANIFLH